MNITIYGMLCVLLMSNYKIQSHESNKQSHKQKQNP